MKFKPYLEVFHLSKLLVPGVQIQIQMNLNSAAMWGMKHGGDRELRALTAEDISVKLFLNQKKVEPSVYRGLMTQFTGPKKVTYPTVRSEIRTYNHANDSQIFEAQHIPQSTAKQSSSVFAGSDCFQWFCNQVPLLVQDI